MHFSAAAILSCCLLSVCIAASAHAATAATTAPSANAAPDVIRQYGLEEASAPVSQRAGWSKPRRILVEASVPGMAEALRAAMPGVEIITTRGADAIEKAKSVDAVVGLCTPQILAAGQSIKWVQILGAGAEQCVGIPAIGERKVLVTNMQRIGGPVIAEHVLAMMLAFTRGLDILIPAQARGDWRKFSLPPGRMSVIQGKTVLVIGLGGIGSEVAKRANALGMRVIATRNSGRTGPEFVSYVGLPDELLKLTSEADFVVNTAPLTPQTTGIFNAAFFAKMKPGAFFINIARGRNVDTNALLAALKTGQIAGAGLDVTEPEPLPPDHPLWSAPNVIITPHIANDSDVGSSAQIAVVKENLRRYIAGERMLSVVDVDRGY